MARSETDLIVFISSRQDSDMEEARLAAMRAIRSFPNCREWAFENTSASSESARDYYLRNAARADFVIWLVGSETTQAVVDEIHACMAGHGRLLAFRLPVEARDERTQQLVDEVSEYAKWCDVHPLANLEEDIRAALSDEINRLVRSPALPGRIHKLRELYRESLARCKLTLTSLGVPDDVADEMALDSSIGHKLTLPAASLQMIVGDQGVGKTLAVERLLQSIISDALEDPSKPFPILVRARNLNGTLRNYAEETTKGYAFPAVQGVSIIIDGIDEIGTDAANRLLEDTTPYVQATPNATAIITTRPISGLHYVADKIEVPALDEGAVLSLISRVAGRTLEPGELRSWVPSLQDAAKYPLFAIMIGAELRKDSHIAGMKASQLVDRIVERALDRAGDNQDEIDTLLQDLAVQAVTTGGDIVGSRVHPKRTVRSRLIDSRLVREEFGKIDFALPLLREWFAARALVEKKVSLVDLRPIADRWVFPIAIAINSENEDLGQQLIAELAKSDPSLASQVLEEVGSKWYATDTEGELRTETDQEIGQAIRRAMEDWAIGLGALMPIIGPVKHDGSVSTIGIATNSRMVYTAWYSGMEQLRPVVELPKHAGRFSGQYDPEWSWWSGRIIPSIRIWPWVITKEMLAASLSDHIGSKRFALQSIDAIRELAFDFACSVTTSGFATPERVKLSEVLRYIDEDAAELISLHVGGSLYRAEDIQLIRRYLVKCQADGEVFISEPWPRPNKAGPMDRSSWGWHETFTEQQLLDRTNAIYAAALRIYTSIVDKWFPVFGNRLRLKCILPARLEGRLVIPNSLSRGRNWPSLTWWHRPLGEHEESHVAFELAVRDPANDERTSSAIEDARQESLRDASQFWYSTGSLHISGSRPATELAHRWLVDELRDIGWTDLL